MQTPFSPSTSRPRPLIVLGAGYTGRWLYQLRRLNSEPVFVTSRSPLAHLDYADPADRLAFNLQEPGGWAALPSDADILWCFPAEPVEAIHALASHSTLTNRRVVVLGSTSAYHVAPPASSPPTWVDETAPLDMSRARVQGEEYLRTRCGAIVLRVAGIYGPGRNPLDWIRQGRVGRVAKYVNLIHVHDLASVCLAALEQGMTGEAYNVSDGTPRTWESICREAADRWAVAPRPGIPDAGPGKRIATSKMRQAFAVTLRYPNLFHALEELEGLRSPSPPPEHRRG